jgi:cysteine-rich repeat protein
MIRTDRGLPFVLSFSALLLIACPSDPALDAGETASETTDNTGDGDGDPSNCGNGDLDEGEACDDGNTVEGDGCSASCQVTSCGLTWSVSVDTPNSNAGAFDVEIADDGSIYAAGVMIGANEDGWAAKWNPDGTEAWSQTFDGGVGNDYFNGIALGAGADGSLVWEQIVVGDMMVMDGDEFASDIEVTPDGDLVILGRTRVGDGDDDVWLRKADAGDGAEIWTSLWSGTGDGMFSTDRSGPVAVSDDGTIWAGAREHVDFDSQEATILQFDAAGNFVELIQPQPAGDHQHDPVDIVAADGSIYFAMQKNQFPYRGWLYKLAPDGTEEWVKTEQDWIIVVDDDTMIGEDWAIRGMGIDADGNLGVGGSYANEDMAQGLTWVEAWVAKVDGAGEIICRGNHRLPDESGLPPTLSIYTADYDSAGFSLLGVHTSAQGNTTKAWTGHFMP